MIKLSRIVKDFKESGALHAQLALWGFVSPTMFLTKSGDVGSVIRVQGVDYECRDHPELDQIARRFEATLKVFDEKFRLYQYLLKRDNAAIPHEDYPENPVLQRAISTRIAYLQGKADRLYELEIYFVVLYEGWRHKRAFSDRFSQLWSNPKAALAEMFSTEKQVLLIEDEIDQARQVLSNRVDSFLIQARDLIDARLLDKGKAFRFFRRLLNYTPYKADSVDLKHDAFLDYFVADEALECHRDHLRLDDRYVKVLTLKEPPAQTFANVLRALQEIPSNFVIVSEWSRAGNYAMRKKIQRARRHHHSSKYSAMNYVFTHNDHVPPSPQEMLMDDAAEALVRDLGSGLKEMEVRGRHFGAFSMTVVLYDRDQENLERSVAECFKVFSTHDALLLEERYNLLNTWLAVVPGNYEHNLRCLYLLNTNYADLSFIFTLDAGATRNQHLGAEYLAVLETEHRTPYFLNLHYQDVAHSLILGATGSGKSFFLNFLLTNAQKYRPVTFIFDLGASYEHVTRMFGGSYLPVGIEKRAFTINPFSLPSTAENRQFLFSFLSVLIQSGGYQMTGADERDLYQQIESLYEIDPEQRRLFTLANILNRNLREPLRKWVEGGQYAALFDNVEDNLTFSHFQCFEFEGMDKYPQVLEPLLFYILHRANALIQAAGVDTTFKVFVMDEAWRFLRDPTIKLYITEALKTWRKRNAAMILATQSSDDLHRSEMIEVIAESCPTKMFLANPGMDRRLYRDTFHLNETEAEMIAGLIPKRQVLVKRPDTAKVVNLNVDPAGYWLYTNDPYDNQRRREAFERHGFAEGLAVLANNGNGRSAS